VRWTAGVLRAQQWRPFESHLPYLLQFLMDGGYSGMGFMAAARCWFRAPLPAGSGLRVSLAPSAVASSGSASSSSSSSSTCHHHWRRQEVRARLFLDFLAVFFT
jgi:hypothetical protein